jgi:hypothetical protein
MARTRYLKPGFFQNDRLAELGPWHRLLFAGLWTIADRAGRLEDRPKRIKGELFPYDTVDVDALLTDLSIGDDPFVVRYEVSGVRYLALPKFLAHQKIHANEAPSVIPACHFVAKSQKQADKLDFATNEQAITTKEASETHQGDYEHALNLNLNLNSNGNVNGDGEPASAVPPVWREPSPKPRTIIEPRRNHAKCYDAPAACRRGYCLPQFQGKQWEAQLAAGQPENYSASAAVVTRLNAIVDATPDGTEVSDTLKWWRAQWAAHRQIPTTEPDDYDWFEECKALHGLTCNGRGGHAVQMVTDAGRRDHEAARTATGVFEHVDQIAAFMGGGRKATA